jgi:hypothetical protein
MPGEAPADLWTLVVPLYAAIVLAAVGLVLGFVAVSSNRAAARVGFALTGSASIGLALALGARGLAAVRRLPAPQRSVFADCDPWITSITALFGVALVAVFVAETRSLLLDPGSAASGSARRSRKRVPWSLLWLGIAMVIAGYGIFGGSCDYPEGSS